MWTMIGMTGGGLILIGGVIWMTYRLAYSKGQAEIKRDIAENDAERRARDAEIAAKPMSRTPLTGPGGMFDK